MVKAEGKRGRMKEERGGGGGLAEGWGEEKRRRGRLWRTLDGRTKSLNLVEVVNGNCAMGF